MNKPIAALISDVHVSLSSRKVSVEALRQGVGYAIEKKIPLIIAGDLHDTKTMWRSECISDLIETLQDLPIEVYLLVGNHDKENEKGEGNALEFLRPYVHLVDYPMWGPNGTYLIPYQSDTEDLKKFVAQVPKGTTIIMHQGIRGAYMGEYAVDKTSIEPSALADYAVISGHYHRRQTIDTDGNKHATAYGVGTFNYIGSPYTISFAEANDGPKGFLTLWDSGALTQNVLHLRKHVVLERNFSDVLDPMEDIQPEDLVWLKVTGTRAQLDSLKKKEIGLKLLGHQNFRLDPIYVKESIAPIKLEKTSNDQILDSLIDQLEETPKQRTYLKQLWRELLP